MVMSHTQELVFLCMLNFFMLVQSSADGPEQVDLQSFKSLAQSASDYADDTILLSSLLLKYMRPYSEVPFRYLNICYTAVPEATGVFIAFAQIEYCMQVG